MKKNVLSGLILLVAISIALSACGGNAAPTEKVSSTQQQSATGSKEIKLTATNFEFDQKEIHVKKGENIKLTLENKTGMHGVAIKDFNVDLKKAGSVEFVADKTGSFDIDCSVMCGAGHASMKSKLIVE
jgi:cytochrome c oxidase subunit 2